MKTKHNTETSHTPGPWIIQDDNENIHLAIVVDSPTESNVIAGPFNRDVARHMANARLIAAAPELLRVSKRLVSDCESLMRLLEKYADISCTGGIMFSNLKQARVAIAEAEGRPVTALSTTEI